MFLLEFEGIPSHRSQMDRMKDVRLSHPLQHIPFDVRKSPVSLFVAEVLYRLIKEARTHALRCSVSSAPRSWRSTRWKRESRRTSTCGSSSSSTHLGFDPGNEYTEGDWFDMRSEGSFTAGFPEHAVAINRPNAALLATLMSAEAEELGTLRLSRTQRADFLSDMLHYFGYHLDAINKVQSLRILGEIF